MPSSCGERPGLRRQTPARGAECRMPRRDGALSRASPGPLMQGCSGGPGRGAVSTASYTLAAWSLGAAVTKYQVVEVRVGAPKIRELRCIPVA